MGPQYGRYGTGIFGMLQRLENYLSRARYWFPDIPRTRPGLIGLILDIIRVYNRDICSIHQQSESDFFPDMTSSNKAFVLSAATHDRPSRIDSRAPMESREIVINRGQLNGQADVFVGRSSVRTTVTGEITPPSSDRPNEGRLFFNVELGMALDSTTGDTIRPRADATSVSNFVERVLKGSKAVDTESLCILGGKSVWSVRFDIHVLNDDGAVLDACAISVLAALLNFRCSSVDVTGDSATVFTSKSREPVPLSIHHLPIATTFALCSSPSGVVWVMDPCSVEEQAFESCMTVIVNKHGELCGIHKPGGIAVDPHVLQECLNASIIRAKTISMDLHNMTLLS